MKIKKRLFYFILFIIVINFPIKSFSITANKIVVSVENQIISSYELKNKIRTILFLSNQNLNQKNIDLSKKRALQQLIDYKLKKNQVEKFNIQTTNDDQLNSYINNVSTKYKTDLNGFKVIFKNNGLDFELYENEIRNELQWQKLIFNMFGDKIVLDEIEIKNELEKFVETQKDFLEYKLAEIEIPLKNNSEDQETILKVNNEIKEIGFEKAALKFSVSSSSLDGGNLGWINSKSLTKEILDILEDIEIGGFSKPIIQTNTATILKLLDKKKVNVNDTDLNKLRGEIIKSKKNELLTLYSNNYLSKIKNNALIELK